ncbi:putative carbonic anhydrase 5 [Hyalella azteca]|uniref:Carbonic anhydrase n=1 Tax=Hyalella azteca TaxID=294128 RepID=A0A8B7MYD9_HYAAZ|nr:putative carbonic anhydrase 5 [Hyalella azteca]
MTAVNDFYTLSVKAEYKSRPLVFGGGLSGYYEFTKLEFHWGSDETQGSEHTIESVQYPLELHMVHSQVGLTSEEALSQPQGLAVLAILFELSTTDNPVLDHILRAIDNINTAPDHMAQVFHPYALASLLPDDVRRYYRYDGSLTTGVFNEAVVWTVFAQPLHVSRAQVYRSWL